jgi:predicted ATP-grasp superfamily ATP-dependent carboligase
MQSIRTLVILGSSLTALAVVRVAHRQGYRVVMFDHIAGPATKTRLAEFRQMRASDDASLRELAKDLIGRNDVAVVADSDRCVRFVRQYRQSLESFGWRVMHPPSEGIDICLDKSAFLKWCTAKGLSAPRLYDAAGASAIDQSAYPLMLRPEWTQHSSNTGLPKALEIREPQTLQYWLDRFAAVNVTPSLCESLLRPGLRQFSIGASRDAAGRVFTFVAEKVRPIAEQCAGGTYVQPAESPAAAELAAQALNAMDFFGIAEVEVLQDSTTGRAYLVEINARPWLQYGLPYKCGVDLLGHALGAPKHAAGASRSHSWLYFSSDLYICFSKSDGLVRQGRVSVGQYLRSLISSDVYASWDWRDPAPGFASMWRTFNGFLGR